MQIRDVMRPGPYTIRDTDTLGHAQRAMSRGRVRHLPVMSEGKLVGMLSERDLLLARAHCDGEPWWMTPVRDVMRSPAQTASPDAALTEIAGRMAAAKIGAMPVVEHGRLLGLATVTDVLDAEVRSAMGPSYHATATAADAMTPWPSTVPPEAALTDAVALMLQRHVRHLPVVDRASTLVGMLSDRDVRAAVGDPVVFMEMRGRVAPQRVSDVMTRPALAIPFDRALVEVARQFADDRLGALPVVDKFGALIGILSYVDALRLLAA